MVVSDSVNEESNSEFSLNISMDNSKQLSAEFENQLTSVLANYDFDFLGGRNIVKSKLESVAFAVKRGNIKFQDNFSANGKMSFSIIVTSNDLLPDNDELNETVSVELTIELTLKNYKVNPKFSFSSEAVMVGLATVALILLLGVAFATGIGEVIAALAGLVINGLSFLIPA